MYKKTTILSLVTAMTLLGGTFFAVVPASAQTTSPTPAVHRTFFSGLIDFISQKFGLDKTKVQAAVKEYQTQHKQAMLQNMQDREKKHLDQLVKNGKITSAQETAILTELSSLKTKFNLSSNTNLTPQERKNQMQNMMNDLKSWAQTNNINPSYVMPGFGMLGRKGIGFGKHMVTPTP